METEIPELPDLQTFSLFHHGITNTIPNEKITLEEFLEKIKTDTPLFVNIRACAEDKDKKNELKKKLSYVTFAGTFSKRNANCLIKSSGLACLDVDNIENLEEARQRINSDKYTLCSFTSPSGKGLKFIVKIPEVKSNEEYKEYWSSIAKHYDIGETDEASKDISRACYVSYDPEPYINYNSEIYTERLVESSIDKVRITRDGKEIDSSLREIIDKDERVKKLFEGNIEGYKSRSEAEMSLVCHLIGLNLNKEQIFKVMASCKIGKWEESNIQYRETTFQRALERVTKEKRTRGERDLIEAPEEIKEILLNKNFFKEITEKEFDKKIVGEVETRKVIFLCGAGGRLIENCQVASYNLLVNDDAGAGKDYVTGAVLKILPKEYYIHKTRISPTVFTYWHNSHYEPEWTWDGKVFYPEDISEIVLNSDVFKVMCSGGSSATITIRQQAVDIEIIGKPVMITTTATATPNPELTRRFVILNLDSSEEQTRAIMRRHSEFKKKGIVPEYNPKYQEALGYLKRVKVKIPFADLIDKHFPTNNIVMRTNYPRFLDFISASAGLYQYQREHDEEGFVIADGQDYDIARECFLKLCSNKYMISLTINQRKILEMFEKEPYLKGSVTKLHPLMNFISDRALMTNLSILSKFGILRTEVEKDSWNRDIEVYSLSKSFAPNERLYIPKYEEICRNTSEPSIPSIPSEPSIPSIPMKKDIKTRGSEGIEGIEVANDKEQSCTFSDFEELNIITERIE